MSDRADYACIRGEAHDFIEMRGDLTAENQKRLGRTEIVGWSWCKRCGASLEVYAGAGTAPQIILPTMTPRAEERELGDNA